MHILINGARLFFDVGGEKLVPDGPTMRERPTLILLHGGPGGDHSMFRPAFDGLADIAQIIYLDHRGNGRSDRRTPDEWTLARWGDDVRTFCDTLGIEKPIVLGYSFGGMVLQAYATRHPGHAGKLVFYSTSPKVDREENYAVFERLGGPHARAVAEARWKTPNPESQKAYIEICYPLYNRRGTSDANAALRSINNDDVAFHFGGPEGEAVRLDYRAALATIQCPSLVVVGEDDPITPLSRSRLLAECLPRHLARLEVFPNAGHGVHNDAPEAAMALLRDFILNG
jgi:pimeloyl-ACP methyl ester carboxylesterase